MKKNIHNYERVLRVLGGGFLASLAFWGPRKMVFLGFLFPMVTGVVGTCPLYSALGVSTRKEKKNPSIIEDNEYFPVESSSEEAAGHPIVGMA